MDDPTAADLVARLASPPSAEFLAGLAEVTSRHFGPVGRVLIGQASKDDAADELMASVEQQITAMAERAELAKRRWACSTWPCSRARQRGSRVLSKYDLAPIVIDRQGSCEGETMNKASRAVFGMLATWLVASDAHAATTIRSLAPTPLAEESAEACTRVLAQPGLSPTDRGMAHFNRGWSHRRAGSSDLAVKDFDAAQALNADFASSISAIGAGRRISASSMARSRI